MGDRNPGRVERLGFGVRVTQESIVMMIDSYVGIGSPLSSEAAAADKKIALLANVVRFAH